MSDFQITDPQGSTPEEDTGYIDINADTLSDVQRGYFRAPSFYGDISASSGHSNFKSGLSSAKKYSGYASAGRDSITNTDLTLLRKIAKEIASYGNVSYEIAEDFLYILINIDKIEDMKKIAEAIDLPELDDESILGNASEILSLPNLSKVAYLANALAGLVKAFARYIRASSKAQSSGTSPLSFIQSALGFFGLSSSSLAASLMDIGPTETRLGHFLSEEVLGTRIPTSVIAQNPMKESPSYVGKVFFGENPTSMSLTDITEIFPKKIGVFPSPDKGSGTTSFGFQNLKSLQGAIPINDVINIFSIGKKDTTEGTYLHTKSQEIQERVRSIIGASSSDKIELNRADNAIPFMIGLSSINAGTETSPFSYQSFQEGWTLSNSLSNYLQKEQNSFISSLRSLS